MPTKTRGPTTASGWSAAPAIGAASGGLPVADPLAAAEDAARRAEDLAQAVAERADRLAAAAQAGAEQAAPGAGRGRSPTGAAPPAGLGRRRATLDG
jgi:hypothetical protein